MDNLFEQFANISKAHAYDILVEQVKELKGENEKLKQDISNFKIHLSRLLYILECERTSNGISLDLRYQTEHTEAKQLLKQYSK